MVEDQVDEVFSLFFFEVLPLGWLGFDLFFLGFGEGATIVFEEFEAELDGVIEDVFELGFFGHLVDQGGIGGRVFGMVFFDEVEVSSVGNHQTVLFEVVEFGLIFIDFNFFGGFLALDDFRLCLHFIL